MRNKLFPALLVLVLACGVPAASLTPTALPTETILPTETALPTMTQAPTNPYPTQEIARIVGSWHVRGEPNENGLLLAVVEDVFIQVIFRARNGWVLIEFPCDNLLCYGWVNRAALEDR